MRDNEAIQILIALNKKTSMFVRLAGLIELSPFFLQPSVSSYIELYKCELTSIRDTLLHAQTSVEDLSVEEIAAIAFASVLFGGSAWTSLPKMFSNIEPSKLDLVFHFLCPLLVARFNLNLVKWIVASWRYLEE